MDGMEWEISIFGNEVIWAEGKEGSERAKHKKGRK